MAERRRDLTADPADRPDVLVTWDMTPQEWQQLRMDLWAGRSPYARQLAAEGKLGPKPSIRERLRWLFRTDRRYIGY